MLEVVPFVNNEGFALIISTLSGKDADIAFKKAEV